jgi:hypothetical protein
VKDKEKERGNWAGPKEKEKEGEKRGLVLNFYVFEIFTHSNKNPATRSMMHKHLLLLKLLK